MNSFQIIRIVANFELKTLLRSWFFRIFAGLFIIGLGIFNIAVYVDSSGSPWLYRALPAAIPYANLIILNLGQAIVAVFLASEFLKQDKKNDTVEVIYVRSMTNAQYIIGKALGILSVFIILNLIILIFGIGFSFLSGDSAKGIGEFFLYPIFISIPTLIFILGLSFFLMTLLKNQAITFILLLGYIALTIFYLNEKYYHLFDYIAYQVPMMNSTIGGFGNIQEIIIHRGIYFLLGIGLIFFTVFKLERLPQSKKFKSFPLLLAFIFLSSGFFLGYKYISIKGYNVVQKKEMIALNNKYCNLPRVHIDETNINLEHTEKTIHVKTELNLSNKTKKNIFNIIFSLNPSLQVKYLKINGQETAFERDLHLIKIDYKSGLKPNEKLLITIEYKGQINENTHSLDQDFEEYKDYFPMEIFKARKRFAYIQNDFVCLTSESLWYPTSGVTYATDKPAYYQPDFTKFSLNVKTKNGLTAVSQGNSELNESGVFEFRNSVALPKISLLIANYKKYSIAVDSVEYAVYTTQKNGYFIDHFTEFKDTLPAIIRELRDEYGTLLDLNYGFDRFYLAEVPIHFALDKHIWSVTSDAVQPEIIFIAGFFIYSRYLPLASWQNDQYNLK